MRLLTRENKMERVVGGGWRYGKSHGLDGRRKKKGTKKDRIGGRIIGGR